MNEQLIRSLINENKSAAEIAKISKTPYSTLKRWLKINNINIKKYRGVLSEELQNQIILENANGLTNKEISLKLNLSPTTVRKYLKGKEFNSVKSKSLNKKEDLYLTQEQQEVLLGSLLGDMSLDSHWKEARFSISQGGAQEAYFDYKCQIFNNILGKISKKDRYDKRTNKYYHKYYVRSKTHPYFTKLYQELYFNNIKTITRAYLDKLTPRSLAFWFMADGNNRGILATNSFSYSECVLIKEWIKSKFNIDTTLEKQYNNNNLQYLIYIKNSSKNTFYQLVKDYIIPEMQYKFQGWEKLEPQNS